MAYPSLVLALGDISKIDIFNYFLEQAGFPFKGFRFPYGNRVKNILQKEEEEMRLEVATYRFGEYDFLEELVEREGAIYVWIYFRGRPLVDKNKRHLRRSFPEGEHSLHIRNFCKKFAENKEYREEFISGGFDDPFEKK